MEFTKKNIYTLFKKMGMVVALRGFDFACDLILTVKENFDKTGTTQIVLVEAYKKIGKRYNVEPANVERQIRYFIELSFTRITINNMQEIFGCTFWKSGYPPIKEFIYSIYNYMIYGGD